MREVILIGGSLDGRKVEVDEGVSAYLSTTFESYQDAGENCFEYEGILTENEGAGPDFVVVKPSLNL